MTRSSETRKEVVGVRLTPTQTEIIDSLVDAGLFKTRSEVAYLLISEGLQTVCYLASINSQRRCEEVV